MSPITFFFLILATVLLADQVASVGPSRPRRSRSKSNDVEKVMEAEQEHMKDIQKDINARVKQSQKEINNRVKQTEKEVNKNLEGVNETGTSKKVKVSDNGVTEEMSASYVSPDGKSKSFAKASRTYVSNSNKI